MLYSVWDADAKVYNYFESSLATSKTPNNVTDLGATIESAIGTLPPGAKAVGSGPLARGKIVNATGFVGLAGFDAMDSPMKTAVLLGIAGLIYLVTRGKKRSA